MAERVALVTGASTGIGRATAERLARDGFRVFGTSRDPSRVPAPTGTRMLALDVEDDESVNTCVGTVLDTAGRIDVLVNNAGFAFSAAVEELTIAEARQQFETNVFGVLRMSRAVLPHMRQQRRGRIINIGSLSADFAIPFGGHYTATKRALQGLSEAMRHEVRPFGVDVCLIEATFVGTGVGESARRPEHPLPVYDRARATAYAAWQRELSAGSSVDVVAARVTRVARARRTRFRYPAGFEALWMPLVRPLIPWRIIQYLVARRFSIHRMGDEGGEAGVSGR
jgi:NAD(P)-dependent dehydrogenase (short-subunit alcohol dehydrogenase family)